MKNRVCEVLGIEKPIIQGPGLWITNYEFVAAVSEAGGLGTLGFNAGQREVTTSIEGTVENMRVQVKKVRELTSKPIAINISASKMGMNDFTLPMIQMMIEEKVEAAVIVGEPDKEIFDVLKNNGIKIIFRSYEPIPKEAKEAVQLGADVIVATGFDEGGTIPGRTIGTFSITPLIVDAVEGKVPVLAAGGIADHRGVNACFALGAEGVFVGSVLFLSKESPVANNIKELAIKSDATDLLMYRDVPKYYRSLPGELPNKLLEMSNNGATEQEICDAHKGYTGMKEGMLFGDLSKGFASFGYGISFVKEILPVKDVIINLLIDIQ